MKDASRRQFIVMCGLPGCGKVFAYNLLKDITTKEEAFKAVKQAYIDKLGKEEAKDYYLEQANLLWMMQNKNERFKL